MIIAAALLFAQPSAPAAETQPDHEIVVIGERLRKLRFKMKRNRTTMLGSCRITRSSGDAVLDKMACDAAVACMGAKKITGATFNACLNPRWKAIVQTRREQLRAARDAS
ncbi:MAG TPA: hypothetical protein VGB59_04380 [Allosphingosinicella sp.]|jgi:hypothetical protein